MNDLDTGRETPELSMEPDDAGAEDAPAAPFEGGDDADTGASPESAETEGSGAALGPPETPEGYSFGPGESAATTLVSPTGSASPPTPPNCPTMWRRRSTTGSGSVSIGNPVNSGVKWGKRKRPPGRRSAKNGAPSSSPDWPTPEVSSTALAVGP